VGEPLELRVINTVDAIRPANAAAMIWLQDNGVGEAAELLANLAVEELVTNCIKYGYADQGEHFIEIRMAVDGGELVIEIIDDGLPFDPLQQPSPDITLPPESRNIGGLGIHLLRTLSDAMTYERRDGRNRVTLMKRLEHA
jgi:anti-sigma regulatory factor (Ser/Thr protein kinase)